MAKIVFFCKKSKGIPQDFGQKTTKIGVSFSGRGEEKGEGDTRKRRRGIAVADTPAPSPGLRHSGQAKRVPNMC